MLEGMDVTVVKEQELPDGNFSTVRSPNPEEKDALTIAIEKAKEIGADSLADLPAEATHKLAENTDFDYCDGCFTGKYPIEVPKEQPKDKFEEKLNKFSAYYQVLD